MICLGFAFPVDVGELAFEGNWKAAGGKDGVFEIVGTGARNNPVRRSLAEPFEGEELFVRFRIVYPSESFETPAEGNGEFCVLWLDNREGDDFATHGGNVPNIGIHVKGGAVNHFMVRFRPNAESYAAPLVPDREFEIVARCWKTVPGKDRSFDRLDMWVDPKPGEEFSPHASTSTRGSIKSIKWLGFATGVKTEAGDVIRISQIGLADSWGEVVKGGDLTQTDPGKSPDEPEPMELADVKPPPEIIESDHWAFQKVVRPKVPDVKNEDWVVNPIDAFVAEKHVALGLTPAPRADKATIQRRISLVLTGLPPVGKTEEQDVEKWLQSRAFGERWGRHWLDVARWAESNGHQHNRDRPYAWRYRDYVINSFRDDKPFDEFVREQIAGDEIEEDNSDALVATGFLAAARYSGNELDKKIQRNDILTDITDTTSEAFLGMTMTCARCHDHFFDPVTAWDYYRMQAFFVNGQPGNLTLEPSGDDLIDQRWALFDSVEMRMARSRKKSGIPDPPVVTPESVVKAMTKEEKARLEALDKEIKQQSQTWGFYSPTTASRKRKFAPHEMRSPLPRDLNVLASQKVHYLVRGDVGMPGPSVEPGWPQVFGHSDVSKNKPRLSLANWIASPENPLTARVWVNRIWQGYFGTGLVATSGNFGIEGTEPSHPELLDWLASELVESGWSSRHIHRLILESNTFQQSSQFSASNQDRDPDNSGLWRWLPRRLEGEAIRDSMLVVSDQLIDEAGGPSVESASKRRSIYLQQKRDKLPDQQMMFDSPNAVASCSRRRTSTVALQPLWLLNSHFMQQTAILVAAKQQEPAKLLEQLFSRKAGSEEVAQLQNLISETGRKDAALALLNTNEFLYIP